MMNATEFRENLYKLLDSVIESGRPLVICKNGHVLKVFCEDQPGRLERLKGHARRKSFVGDSNDIIDMDWSSQWRPKHI